MLERVEELWLIHQPVNNLHISSLGLKGAKHSKNIFLRLCVNIPEIYKNLE
jgi:hypothetical protein